MRPKNLELTLACGDNALTRSIIDGNVDPEGIDWVVLTPYAPDRHWRMLRHKEFDVCELSLGSYLASRSNRENFPFTAIPVFPHRRFRHSYMFKHKNADIKDPGDLAGKKVGINTWQTTSGVWMKGLSSEEYGLDLQDVTWYRRSKEDVPLELSDRFTFEKIPEDRSIDEMLSVGDLDGAFYPVVLDSVEQQRGARRLLNHPFEREREYFERTGIFPLMHTVVIKDEVLDRAPWVARSVFEAYSKSRDIMLKNRRDPRFSGLVWARKYLEEESSFLGKNPWPYGLTENNLKALDKLLEYSLDQEIIPVMYDLEDLFVESTLEL